MFALGAGAGLIARKTTPVRIVSARAYPLNNEFEIEFMSKDGTHDWDSPYLFIGYRLPKIQALKFPIERLESAIYL